MTDPVKVVAEALEREAHPYDFNMWGPEEFAACAVKALREAGLLPDSASTSDGGTA